MAEGMGFLDRVDKLYRDLITPSGGKGPSTTKLVWLHAGMASVYCATLATVAAVFSYLFLGRSDNTYYLFVGALWVNALGFASKVVRDQHQAAKEVAMGQQASAGGDS